MAGGLTQDTFRSLLGYMNAPDIERRCLFVIAARTDPSDLMEYREAFNDADVDGDGQISRFDLSNCMELAWRWFSLSADIDPLFDALNLEATGRITFTEFVAACLHGRLSPLDKWLAQQAFESMDINQDGVIYAPDVRKMFGYLPSGLSPRGPITSEDWCRCLLGSSSRFASSSCASKASEMPRSLSTASTEASESQGSFQRPMRSTKSAGSPETPSLFKLLMRDGFVGSCCAPDGDEDFVMANFEAAVVVDPILQMDRPLPPPPPSNGAGFHSAYNASNRLPLPPPPYVAAPERFSASGHGLHWSGRADEVAARRPGHPSEMYFEPSSQSMLTSRFSMQSSSPTYMSAVR